MLQNSTWIISEWISAHTGTVVLQMVVFFPLPPLSFFALFCFPVGIGWDPMGRQLCSTLYGFCLDCLWRRWLDPSCANPSDTYGANSTQLLQYLLLLKEKYTLSSERLTWGSEWHREFESLLPLCLTVISQQNVTLYYCTMLLCQTVAR